MELKLVQIAQEQFDEIASYKHPDYPETLTPIGEGLGVTLYRYTGYTGIERGGFHLTRVKLMAKIGAKFCIALRLFGGDEIPMIEKFAHPHWRISASADRIEMSLTTATLALTLKRLADGDTFIIRKALPIERLFESVRIVAEATGGFTRAVGETAYCNYRAIRHGDSVFWEKKNKMSGEVKYHFTGESEIDWGGLRASDVFEALWEMVADEPKQLLIEGWRNQFSGLSGTWGTEGVDSPFVWEIRTGSGLNDSSGIAIGFPVVKAAVTRYGRL